MQGKIEILVISETKPDSTFPLNQFAIRGYSKPYRFDRNRNGSGVFICVREDILSRELKIHNAHHIYHNSFMNTTPRTWWRRTLILKMH